MNENEIETDIREEVKEAESQKEVKETSVKEELKATEHKALEALKKLKENVSEEEQTPVGALTLRKILGGDILSAELVRRQVWLLVLISLFTIVYVAFRYQCQQDMIKIAEMENRLQDAKYKAMSCASTLTERSRESRVLEILRQQKDSVLKISDQPPYLINVPED
jgi:hypothetical protein